MTHEIAIVGASTAGLYAAALLARAGRSVAVFESTPELRPAPRTLIVTARYRDLLGPLGEAAIVNEVRRFELFTDGRVASVTLTRPDLVVERATLIRGLAGDAVAHGADLRLGRRLETMRPDGGRMELEFARSGGPIEVVHAARVVGADGAFSRVARLAGWPPPVTVPLVQAVVPRPPDLPVDTTRVWFAPTETRYFYWLIPESETRAVVGLIGEDGRAARRALLRFLERHRLAPLAFQAARVPLYTLGRPIRRRLGAAEIYVVGDAAAQVKVTTVGGLVTGFRGAQAVVELMLTGGRRELRALGRELALHWLVRRALNAFSPHEYGRLLELVDARARRHLGVHTRDEAPRLLARLCLSQPRLALLALRHLLPSATASPAR
jgi:flavin-dependent dehydrogenase